MCVYVCVFMRENLCALTSFGSDDRTFLNLLGSSSLSDLEMLSSIASMFLWTTLRKA